MSQRQMAFDLGVREALGREDFLVSPSNAEAAAWIDRWPRWPQPAWGLALVGPEGSGKSHLAAVWRKASGAVYVDAGELGVDDVPTALGAAVHAVVDRIDGDRDDEAILHLYNTVAERGGSVLILSRTAPARLGVALKDLSSRLAVLPVALIGPPDEALLAGVLAKHFADRQVVVRGDVVSYLVSRMERSFLTAERLADRLNRAALESGGQITTALARRALEEEAEDDRSRQQEDG